MEVNGQHHAPAALHRGTERQYNLKGGWVGFTGESSCPCWDSNLGPAKPQLLAILTTLSRVQIKIYREKN